MSFETIKIHRQYQITNGFVQLPPNLEKNKTRTSVAEALTDFPDATVIQLTGGSGKLRGGKVGAQQLFELPGKYPDGSS